MDTAEELDNAEPESPDFDGNLRLSFNARCSCYSSVIREDRSIVDLLDADYTLSMNGSRGYGIPNVKGSLFRRVTLPKDDPRRGIIGKGSVLVVTSVANRTSPVQRGQFILENVLGAKAPNPPPGVEVKIDEPTEANKVTTLRQRMETHGRILFAARATTRSIRPASPSKTLTRSGDGATRTAVSAWTRRVACLTDRNSTVQPACVAHC
jgi:hypothetical protein